MNPNRTEPDAALSHALRTWQPDAELPPRFHDHVWQRIAAEEARPSASLWDMFRQWLDARLRRPAVALAYVTVLMGIGLTTGYLHARSDATQTQSELRARYVRTVDPFQH